MNFPIRSFATCTAGLSKKHLPSLLLVRRVPFDWFDFAPVAPLLSFKSQPLGVHATTKSAAQQTRVQRLLAISKSLAARSRRGSQIRQFGSGIAFDPFSSDSCPTTRQGGSELACEQGV